MTLPPDLPTSALSFSRRYQDEKACAAQLAALRWPEGFRCRRCEGREAWQLESRPRVFECRSCHAQNSVTAGTVMHRSKVSLQEWFWAAWALSQDKRGVSALQLSKQLGRRYETVWHLLHKLRAALAEDFSAFPLHGVVEVDEAYIGGKTSPRKGGRSLSDHRRSLVVCAVERRVPKEENHPGIRGNGVIAGAAALVALPAASEKELVGFLKRSCGPGTTIRSDGWASYNGSVEQGLKHDKNIVLDPKLASEILPIVHTMFANLRSWLNGTFHGVSRTWLPRYLQEFRWRFNRRHREKHLWAYLLRRTMRKPWVQTVDLEDVEPQVQLAA